MTDDLVEQVKEAIGEALNNEEGLCTYAVAYRNHQKFLNGDAP